jgi:hypothetical protein
MDPFALQRALASFGLYSGKIDGLLGRGSVAAIDALLNKQNIPGWRLWGEPRRLVAAQQVIAAAAGIEVGKVDGLVGPQTRYALEVYAARLAGDTTAETWRDRPEPPAINPAASTAWPLQSGVSKFYGEVGKHQGKLTLPFPMRIAWDRGKTVTSISLHERVIPAAGRVFARIADAYPDHTQRQRLGIDLFGGSLNVRKMRGGSAWSMHSWGIAIDFDPERNQLKWGRDKAFLARPELERFWQLWEAEGFVSLGRARNYDWMHVQAARL